jgi:hypothetical protein
MARLQSATGTARHNVLVHNALRLGYPECTGALVRFAQPFDSAGSELTMQGLPKIGGKQGG